LTASNALATVARERKRNSHALCGESECQERQMTPAYDLAATRSALPITSEWTYLNTGTVGVMAEPVLAAHLANIADHERGGHATQQRAVDGYERARQAVADLVGVSATDIALNRNATDGVNFVAACFPLRAGDEVLTSTEEHPAVVLPWSVACQRAGARLRFVPLSADAEVLAANLRAALTTLSRLVVFSHVSCDTGARVPVEIIRDVVGPDVAVLVDAAQSVGQFDVNFPALRADFVIGNGHKWLAGPKGTGFAWFAPGSPELAPPPFVGDGAVDPRWTRSRYQSDAPPTLTFATDATRYEYGTRAWHTYGALDDAINYQAQLGWSAIFQHVRAMTNRAKEQLAEIPGVTVVTPPSWEQSSGLVTFAIEGLAGTDVSQRLWNDYRIVQRRVEAPSAVRVSCAYFTNTDDLDRLATAVDEIARGR
jgi:selenocysteine lyase/cysteine desulfurase